MLLLNPLEALVEIDEVVGEKLDPLVGLPRPAVLEHEGHLLLVQVELADAVPRELDHLVLSHALDSAGLSEEEAGHSEKKL